MHSFVYCYFFIDFINFVGGAIFPRVYYSGMPNSLKSGGCQIPCGDAKIPREFYSGMPNPLGYHIPCDYLHHQTPPIIHCDLSARNILLNSRLVGKIADLGVARIVPRMRDAATMTKAPGASVYMPPEAITPAESNDEKSKYDASIDVFSLGVVTIFTVGEIFPCDPFPNYTNKETGLLVARTELQRRSKYMQKVNTQLRACGQLREDHPLIRLIQQCLNNVPTKRPNINEVLSLLEEARAGIRDEESERNRVELVHALQNQPRNQVRDWVYTIQYCRYLLPPCTITVIPLQNLVQVMDNLVTENAELQQRLTRKEAELTRAVETIGIEQEV